MSESETSLLEHLDLQQVNCLNESGEHTLQSILSSRKRNAAGAYLLSDADEQLLLNIPFHSTVRIRSIVIKSANVSQAPLRIKILVNRPTLGFEDVEDAEEPEVSQAVELTEDQVKEGRPISLKFVRFQSVTSLHIFVESNQGSEDETRIDAIDVLGTPTVLGTKDLSGLQQAEE